MINNIYKAIEKEHIEEFIHFMSNNNLYNFSPEKAFILSLTNTSDQIRNYILDNFLITLSDSENMKLFNSLVLSSHLSKSKSYQRYMNLVDKENLTFSTQIVEFAMVNSDSSILSFFDENDVLEQCHFNKHFWYKELFQQILERDFVIADFILNLDSNLLNDIRLFFKDWVDYKYKIIFENNLKIYYNTKKIEAF